MDGEPFALRIAEDRRQFFEVDRLERGDNVLGHGINRRSGKIIGGVSLRTAAGLVERDDGGGRAKVVVGHFDVGIAFLEIAEEALPVRPFRAGVERDDHAFLLGRFVKFLFALVEFRAVKSEARGGENGGQGGCTDGLDHFSAFHGSSC